MAKTATHGGQYVKNEVNQEKVKDNKDKKSEKFKTAKTNQDKKFSYLTSSKSEQFSKETKTELLTKTAEVKTTFENRFEENAFQAQSNTTMFTAQCTKPIYHKKDNLSFPELDKLSQPPPALPPKTKIMHSPSRHVFSPTESLDSNGTGTASVKTVEFIPVKEKVKLIAAQQEELTRREEASTTQGSENVKHKGVRILPPSPVTVRKMSVEEELHHYDNVVSRTTPVTQLMEVTQKPERPPPPSESNYSIEQSISSSQTMMQESSISQVSSSSYKQEVETAQEVTIPGWGEKDNKNKESLATFNVDQTFDQLISETEQTASNDEILFSQLETAAVSQSFQSSSVTTQMTSSSYSTESFQQSVSNNMSQAEQCRRSFEEAELEAMNLESHSSAQISKQSSVVETGSVSSFVYHEGSTNSFASSPSALPTKPLRSTSSNNIQTANSETSFRSRQPLKSSSFVRTPETFTTAQSAPSTPMSQRRRLRINQSPM